MKTSTRINDLKLQVRALQSLGFAQKESVRMIARSESHRIRKALPEIDKPLPTPPDRKPGKWVEKTDRINEQKKSRPVAKKPETKPDTKRPTGKHGKPLSFTRFNIKHDDGSVWSYEVKPNGQLVVRPPSQFDTPTYTMEQWQAMHEGINSHINERSKDTAEKGENKQPAQKADDKKESPKMEKSEKTLSRWGRNRTFADITQDVAGVELSQPQSMPVPQTFGKTLLQQAMTAPAPAMNGHQQAAARCGLDINTPGLENMTLDDMKKLAAQQQLDIANQGRGRVGLPPLELETPKAKARKATWSSM